MKPLIGITCNYMFQGAFAVDEGIGSENQQWHLLAQDYIAAIENAGGIPVMIPVHGNLDNTLALAEKLDGVLISGGHDVNPLCYREMPSLRIGRVTPCRDRQELALIRHILERTATPLLGICRGIQILNVALGGTLYQGHAEDGLEPHAILQVPMHETSHTVRVSEGSLLRGIVGQEEIEVNSLHRQSAKVLGRGLAATGVDAKGIVEAVELPERRAFTLAVQWHPETLCKTYPCHRQIFDAFIQAAENGA